MEGWFTPTSAGRPLEAGLASLVGAMESVVRGKNSVAEEELLRWVPGDGGRRREGRE